jgi:zinc transport system substrate-binding protein
MTGNIGFPWIHRLIFMVLLVGLATLGCRKESAVSTQLAAETLHVFVSVPPQKYIVDRVGGEHIQVSVLVSAGQTPHTFEPTPKQVVQLSRADVYFRTGVEFENQLAKKIGSALKGLQIVDLRRDLDLVQTTPAHADEQHSHGHHHHDEIDPHIWMSPRLVKKQAETVRKVLSSLDPVHAEEYAQNCRRFQDRLEQVDRKIAQTLAPLKGRKFFVYHPAFGYFAQAYGLEQVAVETGGRQPTARKLQQLIEQARQNDVKLIFVQPQFSRRSAEVVAQRINGAVVPLNPLREDYLDNLLRIASEIKKALSRQDTQPG